MIDMKLTRQYFDVKDVVFGDKCSFANGVLTVCEAELIDLTKDLFKAVTGFHQCGVICHKSAPFLRDTVPVNQSLQTHG